MKIHTFGLIALVAVTLGVSATRSPANNVRAIAFDVAVSDKDGNPIGGLQRQNFKVFEDNVEQNITSFRIRQEPLAIVILAEFSGAYRMTDVTKPAEGLIHSLQPQDWVALVSFGVLPQIVVDFTHDKAALVAGLRRIQMPYNHDASLYDALYFVLDRFNRLEGLDEKKAIVLLGTGRDTMSNRRSYTDVLKKATTSGTMIYTVGLEQSRTVIAYPERERGGLFRADQAIDTLRAIAEQTGGLSFFPQFEGQYNAIYRTVNEDLRNQYTLGFASSSTKGGGKLRRLKVEVSGTDIDRNGKPDKLRIRNQEGYYAH